VKFLLSPIGIILIVAVLVVVLLPRRAPDVVKKKFGKRPMRAYPDDEASVSEDAERASVAQKKPPTDTRGA
jgi:hypothetical protein